MTRTKDTREAIARALRSNSYGKKWDDAPFNPEEDSGDAAWLRAADAALTALESAPEAGGDVRELLKEALDALELFIPSPMCRDCADENGTCPNSRSEARPCDPHEAAEWARGVRDRASVALTATPAQPTIELAHADKLKRVAAQLSAERFQGWANPLVADIMDAVRYLRKEAPEPDTGEAVLSALRAAIEMSDKVVGQLCKAQSDWEQNNDHAAFDELCDWTYDGLFASYHSQFEEALTATPAQPTRESDKVECLIWSGEHNAYWRPDGAGYTTRIRDAGRYSLEDAKKRTNHCGPEKRIEIEPIAAQPTPERGG